MENVPTSSGSKYRWLWYGLLVFLTVLLLVSAYILSNGRPAYYSPADKVRQGRGYESITQPPVVQFLEDGQLPNLPRITITTNDGRVKLTHTFQRSQDFSPMPILVHRMSATNSIQIEGVTVGLQRMAIAGVNPANNFNIKSYQHYEEGGFFRSDMVSISSDDVAKLYPNRWDRLLDCRLAFPAWRFEFHLSTNAYQLQRAQLLDARTHVPLSESWESKNIRPNEQVVTLRPGIWHEAPVELVVDFTFGEPEVEEIEPVTGASFRYGNAKYYLIYAGNAAESASWNATSSRNEFSLELGLPKPNQTKPKCNLVFLGLPRADFYALGFDAVNKEGKELQSGVDVSSADYIIKNFKADFAEINKIRIRKHSNIHRLIVSLPKLPGLPPTNAGLNNLLAARIPFAAFRDNHEQMDFLANVSQAGLSSVMYQNIPASAYPRYFTNVTAAEILADYEKLIVTSDGLYVEQTQFRFEERKSIHKEIWSEIKAFWKKLKS